MATVVVGRLGSFEGVAATNSLARLGHRAVLDIPGLPPEEVVPPPPGEEPAPTFADLGFLVTLDGAPLNEFTLLPSDDPPGSELARLALLSLIGRRRAEVFDALPDPWGDPPDRGGWWGDTRSDHVGDRWGSRLWLLCRARGEDVPRRAEEYVQEALAWMIEDGLASSIGCDATPDGPRLDMAISITRPDPGGSTLRLGFDLWRGI